MDKKVIIMVKKNTRDELKKMGDMSSTYDSVIREAIDAFKARGKELK